MEKKPTRSSKHLKEALKIKISLDENGKPVLDDGKKKRLTLTLLCTKLKGICKKKSIK